MSYLPLKEISEEQSFLKIQHGVGSQCKEVALLSLAQLFPGRKKWDLLPLPTLPCKLKAMRVFCSVG